jgi:hypothetical protein
MKTKISDLTVTEAISYLHEIGDRESSDALRSLVDENPALADRKIGEVEDSPRLSRATWRGTEHTFGYIAGQETEGVHAVVFAGSIDPDDHLRHEQVDLLLSGLFTMNYPGWGRHQVLLQFTARHGASPEDKPVKVQFQQKYLSREKEGAGILGNTIFSGLTVPAEGLAFEVNVINLANDEDEAALRVLDSDVIKKGLDLVHTAIPGIETVTRLGEGLVKLVLARNRNKIVQFFHMGLNLTGVPGPIARLREGTFVAVQCRRDRLNWSDWVYDSQRGLVVLRRDHSVRLPYNHLLFTVVRHRNGND